MLALSVVLSQSGLAFDRVPHRGLITRRNQNEPRPPRKAVLFVHIEQNQAEARFPRCPERLWAFCNLSLQVLRRPRQQQRFQEFQTRISTLARQPQTHEQATTYTHQKTHKQSKVSPLLLQNSDSLNFYFGEERRMITSFLVNSNVTREHGVCSEGSLSHR